MTNSPTHLLLVEAERYRYLASRTRDPQMAAQWARVVAEYEDLARRYQAFQTGQPNISSLP